MYSQQLLLDASGLHTAENELSGVPASAMTAADNLIIPARGVFEVRGGFKYQSPTFAAGASNIMWHADQYGSVLVGSYGQPPLADVAISVFTPGSGWGATLAGTFSVPYAAGFNGTASVVRGAQANGNFYFTTRSGVQCITSTTATPVAAGMPRGLDTDGALSGNTGLVFSGSTTGSTVGGAQVGYRVVWGLRDANNNLVLGPPSQRSVITNPAASVAVGGLVRVTNVVTVTTAAAHGFASGQTVALQPGEAKFPAGNKTVVTVADPTHFTYAETAADATSTVNQCLARQCDVILTISVPLASLPTGSFYQVYRTAQSVDQGTDPMDSEQLVWEAAKPSTATVTAWTRVATAVTFTTSAPHNYVANQLIQISPGDAKVPAGVYAITGVGGSTFTVTQGSGADSEAALSWTATPRTVIVTDQIPDALREASLYTNALAEGITQSNEQPPICRDLASFRDCMIYADTWSKHRLKLSLLSAGGTQGLQSGDTITVNGVVFTGGGAESTSTRTFQVYTAGTPSQNIANTVASLIRIINRSTLTTASPRILAYGLSGPDDMPGIFLLESDAPNSGTNNYTVSASGHGNAFEPALDTAQTIQPDKFPNRIYWSKQRQPWAVPLLNFAPVGSTSDRVRRIVPLRDSAIIFSDAGVFRLTGTDPSNFDIQAIDRTVHIYGQETAAALGNQAWALSDQGVVAVSDTGAQIMSGAISDLIRTDTVTCALGPDTVIPWGVGDEIDHCYMLAMPSASTDTSAQKIYVHNALGNGWTRWPIARQSGAALSGQVLFGDPTTNKTYYGRVRGNQASDYYDDGSEICTLTAPAGSITGFTGTPPGIGDLLVQGASASVANLWIFGSFAMETAEIWASGAATVYRSIPAAISWVAQIGESPGALKQFASVDAMMRDGTYDRFAFQIHSELDTSGETVTFLNPNFAGWGTATRGALSTWAIGGTPTNVTCTVPQAKSRCQRLYVTILALAVYSRVQFGGATLNYRVPGQRLTR